jgi:hypothetical protein
MYPLKLTSVFKSVLITPGMKCQELTFVDNLGDKSLLLMDFSDFRGTVTAVITMRYDHLPLKLFLPVRRVDDVSLQVIALFMS